MSKLTAEQKQLLDARIEEHILHLIRSDSNIRPLIRELKLRQYPEITGRGGASA